MAIHPSSTATAVIDVIVIDVCVQKAQDTEKMDVVHNFEKSSLCNKCLKPTVILKGNLLHL